MKRRFFLGSGGFWAVWVVAFFLLGVHILTRASGSNIGSIYYGEVPEFGLIDQDGGAFSKEDLLGRVSIIDFIFTTCAGPCPVMSSQLATLQREFSGASSANFVSVSVNPEYDSPAVLKDYGNRYGADFDRWVLLTGDRSEIHRLAVEGFHVGSKEDPIFHSTRFILVDKDAQIRGYYVSSDPEAMTRLRRDLKYLLFVS